MGCNNSTINGDDSDEESESTTVGQGGERLEFDSEHPTTNDNNESRTNNTSVPVSTKKNAKYPWVLEDHIVPDIWKLFEEKKELGRGASCRVVKVINKKTRKEYAMKEMIIADKWNPMLFEQEVYILSKLAGHPNILHYEDCYVDNKNFYVLTSLLKGGELFDEIKRLKSLSEKQAIVTIKTILDAMAYCHERNIVHRDLKPENIVFKTDKHEELVIIDFGDAKEVEEHSKHDDFVGTAFYLAPEAIRSREGWEMKKSDMWTIGVIAYVCVTGRPPFWGRENKEIIRKIIRGNVRFPGSIKLTDECKDFILKLLQKKCDHRLSAKQALQHPWILNKKKKLTVDIIKSLATYGTASSLKKLIVETVAANLDRKHRKEYENQFDALDRKKDNLLDYEEIEEFLVRCGIDTSIANNKAKIIVKNISGNENKPITKEDWNHSNVAKLLSSDHLIDRQYKKLDVDEDGIISCDDLISIFEGTDPEDMLKMIQEIDLDQDGYINYQEFKRCMQFISVFPSDE
mmetsp:Transcript_77119/g.94584  ORF Transcript_77119/g.94584 Transcript_77119/m.94584 type:complete len:516 (+) Transcript_77119:57-1604(+)